MNGGEEPERADQPVRAIDPRRFGLPRSRKSHRDPGPATTKPANRGIWATAFTSGSGPNLESSSNQYWPHEELTQRTSPRSPTQIRLKRRRDG